jgi:hypothetical protein
LDRSKNTFPTASTFTLAVPVEILGTVTGSLPSFAVLSANTIGNVFPPLVDREIFTLAQFTGEDAVFATFQLTVCVVLPVQVTLVFGDVTRKGPAVDVMFRTIASELTPPPAARLSRAVTRKFIARVVAGSISPIVVVLFRRSDNFGNVREGLAVALNERNRGRVPSSVIGGDGLPRSSSSQEYVRASPSGSVALAVKVNGVPIGIVKSVPAETVGGLFPVAVAAAHPAPVPVA